MKKFGMLFVATVLTLLCVAWGTSPQAKQLSLVLQQSLSATFTQADCQQTGGFYVSQTLKICDPKGNLFIPVGTNIMPHYAGEPMLNDQPGPVMSLPTLSKLKVWKFNTVRLNLFMEGLGINPSITKIKRYIENLRSLGLVVIIEPHDYTGSIPDDRQIDQLIAWHQKIINVAKDDPYVWLNLMNEPGSDNTSETAQKWRDSHLRILKALRKIDPKRMILIDAPNYGLDDPDTPNFAQSALLKEGPALKQTDQHLLFSLHTWWGWNNEAETKIKAYLTKTKAAKLPLIFGEFGNRVNDQSPAMSAAQATLKIAREQKLGQLVWEWFGDEKNYLVKAPEKRGYLINSNTLPTNLSELGQLVWNNTHSS